MNIPSSNMRKALGRITPDVIGTSTGTHKCKTESIYFMPTSLDEDQPVPVDQYQENYVATYSCTTILSDKMKARIEKFLSSPEFSSLCCEFYITACVIKQDEDEKIDHEIKKSLISRFAQMAEASFLSLNTKRDAIQSTSVPNRPKTFSHKRANPKANVSGISLDTYGRKPLLQMLEGIFLNLSMNHENISSICFVLFSPYLEKNLIDNSVSNIERLEQIAEQFVGHYIMGKDLGLKYDKHQLDKIYTFLEKFLQNNRIIDKSQKINDVINITVSNNLKYQRTKALALIDAKFIPLVLLISYFILTAGFSLLFGDLLSRGAVYSVFLLFLLTCWWCYNYLWPTIYEDFDASKSDIDKYFSQAKDEISIVDLLKNHLILPNIKLSFLQILPKSTRDNSSSVVSFGSTTNNYNSYYKEDVPISDGQSDRNSLQDLKIKGKMSSSVGTQRSVNMPPSNKTVMSIFPFPVDPEMLVLGARSIGSKYPSVDIKYEGLTEVKGRHGNKYFAYLDEGSLSIYEDELVKFREIFEIGEEVKAAEGSSGIKRVTVVSKNGRFSHALKIASIASRIYGFIQPIDIMGKRVFIVIFCYFDRSGKLTNH